ncbi:MAG TPA: RtcB family protein [Anaerolineaceae bacterium]|nr:RtcB family protein [Anaerolineaceae bacterium]
MQQVITTERVPIKLWLDHIEEGALAQARNLANLPFAFKWVAIMPDCHEGFGMPIGGVLAAQDVIVPNAVGVDIGCGMLAARTDLRHLDSATLRQIRAQINLEVPVGFEHHKTAQPWQGFDRAPDLPIIQQELESARRQLGTLGGGNHFIEIQQGSDGYIWVMIHSGSRNFGLKTANAYHNLARIFCERKNINLPHRDLAYLPMDTREGREYFTAMNYCCDFARANRALMMARVGEILAKTTGAILHDEINIHHNYAALETHYGREVLVHRKGATKASRDTVGIIPGSMGSSSYIVKGLGNPESFESCAHGAGRRMGRKQAIRALDLAEEQQKMNGIVHGLRSQNSLDEAPGAYKDIAEVMRLQQDLVSISLTLTPLASVKG